MSVVSALHRGTLFQAFGWTGTTTSISYGLAFVRSLILARLLYPDDYGLVGLATSLLMGFGAFTEFNITSKLIVMDFANDEEERIYFDTVWTASIIRGIVLSLLVMASAWPAAAWFHDQRLVVVLLIISISPFVHGCQNVGLVKYRKALAFKVLTTQRVLAELTTFVITIILACFTRNYLALVSSQLASVFMMLLLSYKLCSYRPTIAFNYGALANCFHFGKHLFVVSILTFATTQFDNFVVGHYVGPAALGAYILAYRLAMLPVQSLGSLLNSVLFPGYSRIRLTDPHRLGTFFCRLNTLCSTLVLAVVAPLALAAEPVVGFLYGERWEASGELLGILAFTGLFRGLANTIAPYVISVGRADLNAKCKAIEAVVFVGLTLYLVPRLGAAGAAWASLASYLLSYAMQFLLAVHLSQDRIESLSSLPQPFLIGAVSFGVAYLLDVVGASVLLCLAAYYGVLLGLIYLANDFVQTELRQAAYVVHRWFVPQEN